MLNSEKKFHVVCLGCKVNRAEVDEYSSFLLSCGWEFSNLEEANLIIVNTCTVTSVADKKTRQAVHKVSSANTMDDALIVVTGCASEISHFDIEPVDNRICIVSKRDMLSFLSDLCDIKIASFDYFKNLKYEPFRSRASLKIQDGCNNNCTYCIVHTARGREASLPLNEVVGKVKIILEAGIKEIVLSGVNLGAYHDSDKNIVSLCNDLFPILKEYFPARLRISSIEPQNINDEFIEMLANSDGKICRHLHLPLQSGSSKVLKEMNRKYSSDQFLTIVKNLRKAIPEISLSTDIIVGFPGESEEDFQETIEMCKACSFSKIHVFPYSKRQGTPAAERKDQVAEDVKKQRAKTLRILSDTLRAADLDKRVGTEEYVLCESTGIGRTESYHRIEISNNIKPGILVKHVL